MDYQFENGKKISDFQPIIGKEWSKQDIKNKHLNTIFNLIDDGDKKLSEKEFDLFQRLLKSADGITSGRADNVADNNELKVIIDKINNGEIKLENMRKIPAEVFDRSLYTKEALKKRYPDADYEFVQMMSSQTRIVDKKTGKPVLEIIMSDNPTPNDVSNIIYYDSEGRKSSYAIYNAKSNQLEYYKNEGEERHNIIPELLWADIKATTKLGFPTTGEHFEEHLNKLTRFNIESVMSDYKELSGSSLISDIMTERGLSAAKRAELAKKVIDVYIEARKGYVGSVEGFKEAFYEKIDNERDGYSPMSAKKIEELMYQLEDTQREACDRQVDYAGIYGAPDGKINNDFSQGSTGDCWVLGAVKSIMSNPYTARLLNEQISMDDKGNVTVNLVNVGKSYTFSTDEICRANRLASGDMDVRALEMAIKAYLDEDGDAIHTGLHSIMGDENLDGGTPNYIYEILLGRGGILNATGYSEKMIFTKSFIDDYLKNGKYLVTVSSTNPLKSKESDFEAEGNDGSFHKLITKHVYSVVGADDNYVYIVNPWDSSVTLKITHDQFVDFFGNASVCSVDKILKKIAEKYNFGPEATVSEDGRVFIPYIPPFISKPGIDSVTASKRRHMLSTEELMEIKESAIKKYGNDYDVKINGFGDLVLSPKMEDLS